MSLRATLEAAALGSAWPVLSAWLVGAVCVWLAWRTRSKLERLAPPGPKQLLAELRLASENPAASEEVTRRLSVAELNDRLGQVSFELNVLLSTFAALLRISLASGTALAVVGFLTAPDEGPVARAMRLGFAALAGLLGAGGVASIGHVANTRCRQIKEEWDISSRDIGKALGASLEAPMTNQR